MNEIRIQKAYELIEIPNGYIKKYADGTAEYHENIMLENINITLQSGSIYYNSGGRSLGIFKDITFIKVPVTSVQIENRSHAALNFSIVGVTEESKGTLYLARGDSTSGVAARIHYHAYGFWK